jgi:outer membrane lipase/esterase
MKLQASLSRFAEGRSRFVGWRCAFAFAAGMMLSSLAPVAQAGPYDSLYVLGDSLSDSGNAFALTGGIPPDPYFQGRFTNGLNYADRLAQRLGLSAEAVSLGGTNFAIGGATASPGGLPISLVDQGNLFLLASGGVVSPKALFVTWIGSNDVQNVLDAAIANPASLATASTVLMQSVADFGATLGALTGTGARTFLVPTVPLLGLTPGYAQAGAGIQTLGNKLSTDFNDAVDQMLLGLAQQPGAPSFIRLDINDLFSKALANPAAFGFTNVTDACISGDEVNPGTVCANPDQYLFWDSIHPSARGHALIADAAFAAVVPLPGSALLFAAGLLVLSSTVRRPGRRL